MKCPLPSLALGLGLLLSLTGCATDAATPKGGGSAEVVFVEPEKYHDVQVPDLSPSDSRKQLLPQLKTFIEREVARTFPAGTRLELRILNLDEPGRIRTSSRGGRELRITSNRDEARVDLEYVLRGRDGRTLKAGQETLYRTRDQSPPGSWSDKPLALIKDALRAWMRSLAKS
jgi:hypothetical protein